MQPLCVVGPSEDRATLVAALTRRLAERGRVATVEHRPGVDAAAETDPYRDAGATAAYTVGADGWAGTGTERGLTDLLSELAPDHDYLLVAGGATARLPTVALDGHDHAGETVATAPDARSVDLDAVVAAVAELEPFETLASLVDRATAAPGAEYAGAVATFTGRVRRKDDPGDTPTEYLEFERYEGVAAERMAAIESDLVDREGVQEVLLHHRTGVVEAGEDIVFVVVLAGHREAAFRTVSDGIDRLKAEVPLFKKEVTVDGEFWAHQHGDDHHPDGADERRR
jgi:molybdopterin synthase catalytic subunit